jgi:hypothetical protein
MLRDTSLLDAGFVEKCCPKKRVFHMLKEHMSILGTKFKKFFQPNLEEIYVILKKKKKLNTE